MQVQAPALPDDLPFAVRFVQVPGEPMPLAAARNAAANSAQFRNLIFLDVDCIPSPTLVESLLFNMVNSGRCLLGEVRYLPATVSRETIKRASFEQLLGFSVVHPARPQVPGQGWCPEPNARALWGLSFALTREQYFGCGGMDERYVGYGGEETDFAEKLRVSGVTLGWCGQAMALHQYHRVCSPPLDRFDEILANAQRFYDRWGCWCLEYWLGHFVRLGLIRWSEGASEIVQLRQPAPAEVRACYQPPEVAFA